jgi:1-phosphofructokinase
LAHRDVPIAGAVRTNVSLIEADGTTTKVNEPGPQLSTEEADNLVAAALTGSTVGEWIVWCGSLPAGFGAETLADAIASARKMGRRVALDSSGTALATALRRSRDELPDLIKPNAEELAELAGASLHTLGDAVDAATLLVRRGVGTVLVTLGGDGAILVSEQLVLHGEAPVTRIVNTVGAGDAFLAGYFAAAELTEDHRLISALRFGATAVQHDGTVLRELDPTQPVQLYDVDRSRVLHRPAR